MNDTITWINGTVSREQSNRNGIRQYFCDFCIYIEKLKVTILETEIDNVFKSRKCKVTRKENGNHFLKAWKMGQRKS